MEDKYLFLVAICVAIIAIYISEVSNPCAAWIDSPCEWQSYPYGERYL